MIRKNDIALVLVLSLSSLSLAAPAAACGGYSRPAAALAPDESVVVAIAAIDFAARRFPRLMSPRIEQLLVDGDRASAVVHGQRTAYRLELRRMEAGWRVARWSRHTPA